MEYKSKLKKIIKNSYSPYYKFKVACLLETKDGNFFEGVNVENAVGSNICAERTAIVSAITKGYKKGDFKRIYVFANGNRTIYPCFICRQTFLEFFNMDEELILINDIEEKRMTIGDIIVYPFSSKEIT